MSMTKEEKAAKYYLSRLLASNGYPTYAKIFSEFDFNYTDNPSVIAFMEPNKGRIVMNRGLDAQQASVVVRHEILHQYLNHEKRLLDKVARNKGLDPDDLDDITIEDLKKSLYSNQDFNIAADYEISNRGYTDKDKDDIRNIQINGRILSGLVTEDDHPDWVELSVEEMYDELERERNKVKPENNEVLGKFIDETTFVSLDGTVYGY